MAGDWIKMRTDLFTHPKVVRISSALKADTLRTVGGLMSVWSLFDAHSLDGSLSGYSLETLDTHLRWEGFAASMVAVGWLEVNGENVALPRFDDHNGQSAKRRAQDADRKKTIRKTSASEADKMRTREEKRREEQDQKPSPSATQTASNDPPASELNAAKTERIRQVTADAIDAYNAQLAQPVGLLPAVRPGVGIDARMRQVRRCIKVAREICADQFGSATITRDFWTAYFGACAADPFKSGRQSPGKGHENWTPNFEYLTRESVVLEVFDRATTEAAA